jgi:hypothetical protein
MRANLALTGFDEILAELVPLRIDVVLSSAYVRQCIKCQTPS